MVVGCMQKWEVGSWLWSCLEMVISQDNGLDFLGLSWWVGTGSGRNLIRTRAWACDLGLVTSPLCLIYSGDNNPTSQAS